MEALGHGLLPLGSLNTRHHKQQTCQLTVGSSIHFLSFPLSYSPKQPCAYRNHIRSRTQAVLQQQEEEYELKQMKDMAAAKKRWDSLIRDGKVKPLTPREAGYAIQLSNKPLLDVRPSTERNRAWVKGSTWIPIFDVDTSLVFATLTKKATSFLMGGWWSGAPALSYNKRFLSSVEEKFAKDGEIIVACQKGLRSIAACEVLYNAGYKNIFWVQGGLEAAEEEDLVREGTQPFKFAGIGGLSEFLGWTDQQREAAAKEGWGYRFTFTARLFGLVLAADAVLIGAQKATQYLQQLRSH